MTDTKKIVPFEYESHQIRTIIIDGEPWFVAADLCRVLGISDTRRAVERLDDDEKKKVPGVELQAGQNGYIWIVNESGAYALILRSDKPTAKAFRKYVTSEVLPALRRTGSYVASGKYEAVRALAAQVVDALGSQNKLAKRIGISSAHISEFMNGRDEKISDDMVFRIEAACRRILEHGDGYDPELVQLLIGIEDNKTRKALFNKLLNTGNI